MTEINRSISKNVESSDLKINTHPILRGEFFTFVGALPVFNYGSGNQSEEKILVDVLDIKMEASSVAEIVMEE